MQAAQQHTGAQQVPPEPMRRRINNFLAHWVTRLRIALLVVLIAAATFLVAYFVYNEVAKKRAADSALMAERLQTQYDSWRQESDAAKTLREALNIFKKHFITKALESNGWHQTRTAKALAIQRSYLSKLVKELSIMKERGV